MDRIEGSSSKPNFWQMLISVLGAVFGIQSTKVRQRDFENGHAWWVYLIVGILTTLVLILLLVCLVTFILSKK
ncbi:MAG: hypothetical protein JWM09_553 [Francisellaceae bacterium]|nr:hypothetical protein [Francisellaceae bacterium]